MSANEKSPESVRAVNRALDVLLAFTPEDVELTASELLQRVDLSRPTLYRLLYTLETKRFIVSSGDPQRFRLGPAIARLAHVWNKGLDIGGLAEPIMRRLWQETRETVSVFVAQQEFRMCLAEMPSPQPLTFKRGVGFTERIAVGATGRAILAWSIAPDADLSKYLEGLPLTEKEFRAELQATRERGYAISRDELIDGAVAVAAPFYGPNGVVGSLGVYGPATRLGSREVAEIGRRVMEEAVNLSRALGVEG